MRGYPCMGDGKSEKNLLIKALTGSPHCVALNTLALIITY